MEHNRPPRKKLINSENSIYWKAGFILLLISLLTIPNGLVQSLIQERQNTKYQVQNEIANSWGNRQTISGPILAIPYTIQHKAAKEENDWVTNHMYYLAPEEVNIDAEVDSEVRKKSIYEEVLYTSGLNIKGAFDLDAIPNKDLETVEWSKANLIIGIFDPSGINANVKLSWNDVNYSMSPGSPYHSAVNDGIHTNLDLSKNHEGISQFQTQVDLRGHYYLYFDPTAKNTAITMRSDWHSPGFVGKVLAEKHEITAEGFTANWKVSEYSRSVPSLWSDDQYRVGTNNRSFGVELIQPVDQYQQNMRSAKYALLIISLSFLSFFFFEIMYRKKVHPVQYTFIGLSLSIFYYLLLSISEHLGFDMAYMIATSSVIALILGYSKSILKNGKSLWILGVILILIYSYIFVLLQLEEYALIAGSIGLFSILALVMYMSRNVDWYNMNRVIAKKELDRQTKIS